VLSGAAACAIALTTPASAASDEAALLRRHS
jgi:hypothetical protein